MQRYQIILSFLLFDHWLQMVVINDVACPQKQEIGYKVICVDHPPAALRIDHKESIGSLV